MPTVIKKSNMKYKYTDEKKEHLHTLDGKPLFGTSSVCSVLAKPLTWWASGMAVSVLGWSNKKLKTPEGRIVLAAERLDQIKTLDAEAYLSLLDKAYGAHNEKKETAAEEGTDMHSLLEKYVKECITLNEGKPLDTEPELGKVFILQDWAVKNVKRFIASEVHTFSPTWWIGGISDCVAELQNGQIAIIDFKSSKEAYDSHFIQIAGYDRQMREKGGYDKDGNKTMKNVKADVYIVFPFGAEIVEPVMRYNTKQLRACFKSALTLYKSLTK